MTNEQTHHGRCLCGAVQYDVRGPPRIVVFARNRKPWDVMDESIQTYDAQPAWNPNDGV